MLYKLTRDRVGLLARGKYPLILPGVILLGPRVQELLGVTWNHQDRLKYWENSPYKFYQNITFILQIQKVQHILACIIEWKMFSFSAKDRLMVELHAIYEHSTPFPFMMDFPWWNIYIFYESLSTQKNKENINISAEVSIQSLSFTEDN